MIFFLLSSTCIRECCGEIQLSVNGKMGHLMKEHIVGLYSVYLGVVPPLPCFSPGSHAWLPGVVGPECWMVGGHACEVAKPLYPLLFNVVQDRCHSYHFSDHFLHLWSGHFLFLLLMESDSRLVFLSLVRSHLFIQHISYNRHRITEAGYLNQFVQLAPRRGLRPQ